MKGDFTRVTFRPHNHYSGVLQQQGRVQLDADWNEQVAVGVHVDRTTTGDLVGGCGALCDTAGFGITCDGDDMPARGCAAEDLRLEAGHYYVDGILVESEDATPLGHQPDLPGVALPQDDGRYLAYLDVWEEHLTALERPELREVALGGPDTATRSKTVWQVKLELVGGGDWPVCSDFGPDWTPAQAGSTGRLAAQAATSGPITHPCIIPPGAGFRRLENQLYRVEIHDGSHDAVGNVQTPTFKVSRDNGSVVAEVSAIVGTVVAIAQPGRGSVLGFATGDWVEISDEGRTLRSEPGILVELANAEGTELTVASWNGGAPTLSADFATTVRRWDSVGAPDVEPGVWLELEDGVQVQFEDDAAQTYRTGDYWVIPARTADIEGVSTNIGGSVEWPEDPATGLPAFELRHGIDHHYCPVALLERVSGEDGTAWTLHSDCRRLFPALTELTQLVYVGGAGQEAMPGDPLPQPLEVGVWNGGCAIRAARVRFVTEDGGTLTGGGQTGDDIVVPATEPEAIASCVWTLADEWVKPSQLTRATLLDDHDKAVGLPIDLTANLSIASEVAYDPTGCDALADEVTVQDAIRHLSAASSLAVRCGDGQEAMPGSPLPQPLEVVVASACGPTEGAVVEFAAEGEGLVAATVADPGAAGSTFSATTDAQGRASCVWQLEATGDTSQRVEVKLTSTPNDLVEEPTTVCFTGQLSVASEVAYAPGCEHLAETGSVQEAIDALCANVGLYYVSGDGQEARPDTQLPHSLQVRVANGRWPSVGAKVLFAVVQGDGTIIGDDVIDQNTVVCVTDADGIAAADWILGRKGPQRIEARLAEGDPSFTVAFNAQFTDAGIRITDVRVGGRELLNDTDVEVTELVSGIMINFDQPIDDIVAREGLKTQPVMNVTVDFPSPYFAIVAFQPLVLRCRLSVDGDSLLWRPWDAEFLPWIRAQMEKVGKQDQVVEHVLAHLVLKGNFIWAAEDPSLFLDGDSFGTPARDGRIEILRDEKDIMSGDGRSGGDFEMWFWLVRDS